VQTRYIGSARVAPTYVTGVDIDHNWIAPVAYLDLRGSYQWNDKLQFYFAVDNLQNIPPGEIAGPAVYDELGRAFRLGVRLTD
jgi:outer membrane receptor protein involved in Fe transport